jgi:hypothetical protein
MAIAPLQLPSSQGFSGGLDFAPLANLGKVYEQAQAKQALQQALGGGADLTDPKSLTALAARILPNDPTLGLSLTSLANTAANTQYQHGRDASNDQWREQESARSQGNTDRSLGFQANADARAQEAQRLTIQKQADELAASKEFNNSLGSLYNIQAPAGVPSAPPPGAPPAPVAQAQPVAPGDPTMPQISPRAIQLIAAAGSPRLPQAQRETAKTLLTAELDASKATGDIKEWAFAKAQDPNTEPFTTWLRNNKAASKTEVNIDQKSETAFAKEGGGGLGKQFVKLSEEGQSARQDLALVGQLRDLGAVVQTGAPAAIQGWLANQGIKVGPNVGAVEAYGSIIDKLTPAQRIPGSGATSDYEGVMFKNSLPKLINTPQGNEIISNTLASLAQYKVDRAVIAEKALSGELKPGEALTQMRALPSPYANFKEFAKGGGFRADQNDPGSTGPTPTGRQPTTAKEVPMTNVEIDQSLANARAAVARNPGARDAIAAKLKAAGIDPGGL